VVGTGGSGACRRRIVRRGRPATAVKIDSDVGGGKHHAPHLPRDRQLVSSSAVSLTTVSSTTESVRIVCSPYAPRPERKPDSSSGHR
jgi:hypothetical protein